MQRRIDAVFTLLLFTVFTLSVFAVMIFGVRAYISVNNNSDDGYDLRTCVSYIETKVRQSDGVSAVSIGEIDGSSALLIEQTIDGTVYQTALYACDGGFYELFAEKDSGLGADSGTKLLDMGEVLFAQESGNMLYVTCTDLYGDERSAHIYLAGSEAAL